MRGELVNIDQSFRVMHAFKWRRDLIFFFFSEKKEEIYIKVMLKYYSCRVVQLAVY